MKRVMNISYIETQRPNYTNAFAPAYRRYALFPNDNAVTRALIEGWVYEEYVWRFINNNSILLDGTDIIDVGANNGSFTVEFAHFAGNFGRVHSFEPQRIVYQELCANVFLNGLDNVFTHHAAVGDQTGEVFIDKPDYFQAEQMINLGDVSVADDGEKVRSVRLDDFEFEKVSLIKIDVQGYEPNVIRGAEQTIQKHRPFIICEVEQPHLEKFGGSAEALIKQIEDLGYVMTQFDRGVKYVSWNGECLDYVGIPKEVYEAEKFLI